MVTFTASCIPSKIMKCLVNITKNNLIKINSVLVSEIDSYGQLIISQSNVQLTYILVPFPNYMYDIYLILLYSIISWYLLHTSIICSSDLRRGGMSIKFCFDSYDSKHRCCIFCLVLMTRSKSGFKRYVSNDQKEAHESQFKILVQKTEWLLQDYFIWTKIVQF